MLRVASGEDSPVSRETHSTTQIINHNDLIERLNKIERHMGMIETQERTNLLKCFETTQKDRNSFKRVFCKISLQLSLCKERLQQLEENQKQDEAQKQRILEKLRRASAIPNDITYMKRAVSDLAQLFDTSSQSKPPPSSLIRQHVSDFYCNVSLPGVKYCMEQGRHSFERYMWIMVLVFCILVSSQFIHESYVKWRDSPTLLSFNDSMSSVGILPFPAVTVCSPGQLNSDFPLYAMMNYCKSQNCEYTEKNKLLAVGLLNPHCNISQEFNTSTYPSSVGEYIKLIARECGAFIPTGNITFKNKQLPCQYALQTTFVDGKVCHTFNMLPETDIFNDKVVSPGVQNDVIFRKPNWTLEYSIIHSQNQKLALHKNWTFDSILHSGYLVEPESRRNLNFKNENRLFFQESWIVKSIMTSEDVPDILPRSSNSSSRWNGLMMFMDNSNNQELCPFANNYTKIAVHPPGELPMPEAHTFYRLENNHLNVLRVSPHLVTAQEELLDYPPYKRKCFFSHERKLSLFRIYTKHNCQLECKANCSLSLCGCIPFYLPRHNSSIEICGPGSFCGNFKIGNQNQTFLWNQDSMERFLHEKDPYNRFAGYAPSSNITEYLPVERENQGQENTSYNDFFQSNDSQDLFYNDDMSTDSYVEDTGWSDLEPDLTELPQECVCDCGADCVSLTYTITREDQPFDNTKKYREQTLGLALSYKESEFTSIIRKELVSFTDFIANSGGVLGVFTGFSFLAVVELFYYLTLRLWSSIKRSWEETEG